MWHVLFRVGIVCLEDILTKGWVNQWVSDGDDCRTAPATPGLLNTEVER